MKKRSQHPVVTSNRRTVSDAYEIAGVPLLALGAVPRRPDQMEHVLRIPELGLSVVTRRASLSGKMPSATVYDVLVAILYEYQVAEMPADGVVQFSRQTLIRAMRWVEQGERPAGRHYAQLADALMHLQHIQLAWDGASAPYLLNIERRDAVTISLVSDFRLGDEPVGRRPAAHGDPDLASWVRLDPGYAYLLSCPYARVEFDLDRMMALSTGVARILFRTLMWLRHCECSVISLWELFLRIGSSTDRATPAQARELLGRAHREMVETGVLRSAPVYSVSAPADLEGLAEYVVTYDFGAEETLSPEDEALVRAARKHGVSKPMAVRLLEHRDQLRIVLKAVDAGSVTPRYPAGYIVDATRGGWSL